MSFRGFPPPYQLRESVTGYREPDTARPIPPYPFLRVIEHIPPPPPTLEPMRSRECLVFLKTFAAGEGYSPTELRTNLYTARNLPGRYVIASSAYPALRDTDRNVISIEVVPNMSYYDLIRQLIKTNPRPLQENDLLPEGAKIYRVASYEAEVIWETRGDDLEESVTVLPQDPSELSIVLRKMEMRQWNDCFKMRFIVEDRVGSDPDMPSFDEVAFSARLASQSL